MYIFINPDNSVNYANNHPVNWHLFHEGLRLIEFPEKELFEVVKDIPPEYARWDEELQEVYHAPDFLPEKLELNERRRLARERIVSKYPVFKQMNIMRSGDEKEIEKMGKYIDEYRAWSNDHSRGIEELEKIEASFDATQ
ncbi:hypothetical protein [Marinibactrum halimedae]|uniref:Uncharacterized protein n=1 Tax=Marinibactrum halimedae TaxID=1444977 RepID=A0AA37WNG5_9GAMM|nr:hypothetical protein [Marinibactrum halimedae]MCD9458454.1 hypothetical protein [Marinibactrum halimedae]GLS26151.1 hypothetical protein GCM10007877_18660 [Marinibactrum halimedae]